MEPRALCNWLVILSYLRFLGTRDSAAGVLRRSTIFGRKPFWEDASITAS